MRVITLNLNGIRSATEKGFFNWLAGQDADIVCLQELKAQAADMSEQMLYPHGYRGYFHYAEKRGYSGVGIYSRHEPDNVIEGLGLPEFDCEGRYIEVQFGNMSIISVYLPSGSSGAERQTVKYRFMEAFMPHLLQMIENPKVPLVGESRLLPQTAGSASNVSQPHLLKMIENPKVPLVGESRLLPQTAGSASNVSQPHLVALKQSGREIILCGDWNIAHTEKDLKNWRGNRKNSGFLPEERAWLSELLEKSGLVDVFRRLHPDLEAYTWWSNRGRAWDKNVGWRIDYQIATPGIAAGAQAASIYKEQRFSDHAPLIIDYA